MNSQSGPEVSERSGIAANTMFVVMLVFGIVSAALAIFLPDAIGLTGMGKLILQVALFAVAAGDVAIGFWLRARKAR